MNEKCLVLEWECELGRWIIFEISVVLEFLERGFILYYNLISILWFCFRIVLKLIDKFYGFVKIC